MLAAVAAGAIAERDAELILQTRVDGIRLRLVARSFGVSYHALRQRRQRAEKRLRELLAANGDVSKQPLLDLTSYRGTFSRAARYADRPCGSPAAHSSVVSRDAA